MTQPGWMYDELRHPGVDYGSPEQVATYDRRHTKFRDYRKEAETIVRALGLTRDQTVLDLGSGTGAFALHAAPLCRTVYAVDVSPAMLDHAARKAAEKNLRNIVFRRGGFLTYDHDADPFDAAVSTAVLHHLPDFWKFDGLRRVNRMLKSGGKFYMYDVVFPGAAADQRESIERWIRGMRDKVGREFAAEVETHIRDEFSTYDWIMEGMLTRAGFRIDAAQYGDGFGATYLCTKTG